jgi:hypothetical protein
MKSAVAHLLRFMRLEGLILTDTLYRPSAIQNELADFTNHLRGVCGLAANTVVSRRQWVGRFLTHQFSPETMNVAALVPSDLHDFVKTCCSGFQPGTVGVV